MRHPHVRVYASDRADAADLVDDYPCRDLVEAHQRMLNLVREYTNTVGATEEIGVDVEFEDDRVVTLRAQDPALLPRHLAIHFCDQPHETTSSPPG
jgi:hypothetical protein